MNLIKMLRLVALYFFCLPLFVLGCFKIDPAYKDKVVVRVNDATLTAEEFSESLASRLRVFNSLSAKDSAVINQAKKAVIQDFIVRVVTQEWAQKNQIFVRKEQVDTEINKIRSTYPDEIAFRKALADEGLTFQVWEQRLQHNILERIVLESIRKGIAPPTDSDIKAYYARNKDQFQLPAAVRLRQVVSDSEDSAKKIKKEISAGRSISELAKKFSISMDASVGGAIGWVEKGSADFFDTLYRLNVGQKSNIIPTAFGFHIFEILEKRTAKNLSLNEAESKIKSALFAEREQEAYTAWLEEQVLSARVFKDDEFINHIQVHTRSIR